MGIAKLRSVMTRGLVTATIALGICATAAADSPGTFSGWQQGMCLSGIHSRYFPNTMSKDECLAACAAATDSSLGVGFRAHACAFRDASSGWHRNCMVSFANETPQACLRNGFVAEAWAGSFTPLDPAAQRAEQAHEKALEDSFKTSPGRPVSTATAASRNACLRGDAAACRALHPAEQPPKDSETECREQLQAFLERCQRQTSECQQKCSERRWACWKDACDAACAGNPTSVKCMLCACPQQIDCDCNFCQSLPRCSQRPEGQTQVR